MANLHGKFAKGGKIAKEERKKIMPSDSRPKRLSSGGQYIGKWTPTGSYENNYASKEAGWDTPGASNLQSGTYQRRKEQDWLQSNGPTPTKKHNHPFLPGT